MATLESVIVEDPQEKPIDREKTCPLLLRVFCSTGRHNSMQDYAEGRIPTNELQIYTWMDATLKEISGLVREVNPDARRGGTVFDFSLVYPDPAARLSQRPGAYRVRAIGTTVSGQKSPDDNKSLSMARFTIGDYMDICITPPQYVKGAAPKRRY